MASTLAEDLVQEILIRISPEEPIDLVHATLVCKSWRCILSDPGFLCRYRRFHGTPPLLGYIENHEVHDAHARFFPTTLTTSPVSMAALTRTLGCSYLVALDCRHGRVLIYVACDDLTQWLIVCDPITGDQHHLSVPPRLNSQRYSGCTGSVLCATNGCDHLDCGSGPFAVVFVSTSRYNALEHMATSASMYSSETGVWSAPASVNINGHFDKVPGVLISDTLYYTIDVFGTGLRILRYNLYKHVLSVIDAPRVINISLVMEGDGRGLRLVTLSDSYCIDMWSLQQDTNNGIRGWMKHNAIDLPAQLREHGSFMGEVIGFVEGTDIIFISTVLDGIFTMNLKSRQVTKVYDEEKGICSILPYRSFYTPR